MKQVYQTIFTDEKNGIAGNCLQAAIACILELDINEVPHFVQIYDNEYYYHMDMWLNEKGYETINEGYVSKDEHYIAVGKSPRFEHGTHCCIYKAGEFVFDVHPKGGGIEGVNWVIIIRNLKLLNADTVRHQAQR